MFAWTPDDDDDSDSDHEVYDGPNAMGGRDAVVFLIDSFLSDNKERFQDCLNLIRNALLSGLLTRERDLIGIAFCNTANSPDPKDMAGMEHVVVSKNTAVLLPLKQLSKDIVDYYLNFATEKYFDFTNCWGTADGSFANSLRLCANMFKESGWKLRTSNIVYFTDRAVPHPTDKSEVIRAFKRGQDLQETDIEFNLIPMQDDFDYDKFFKEFICMVKDIDLDEFVIPNIDEERKMIANRNLKQSFKKCLVHLKWTIGDDFGLSVVMYHYFKKSIYPKSIKISRDDNTVIDVKRRTKVSAQNFETEEIIGETYLKPGDERKVLNIGGRIVALTTEELNKFKYSVLPGIRLLGFKSKSALSIHNFHKSATFIYPNDKIINGSTTLFRAIWEKCLEKEKIAICYMVARRKTVGRYVALEPTQSTDLANKKAQIMKQSDGFRVLSIPDQSFYRQLDLSKFNNVPEVPAAGVELFKKVAKKLKICFTPDDIKDPLMEILHPTILGTAFDIEMQGNGDGGMPDIEMQDSRIEKYIDDIVEIFGRDVEVTKRKRIANNGEERVPKLPKIDEECPSEETIERLIRNDELNALTVKQLKSYLQTKDFSGLSTAAKPTLIEKIIELHK